MNKRKNSIIAFMVLMFSFSSCYKEDAVQSELGQEKYKIEDSSDSFNHYRYLLYKNTGVSLLAQYDETDFIWNISGLSNNLLTMQEDKDVLEKSMNYLNVTLFDYYNDDFKKKYFPHRILLAKAVDNSMYDVELFDNRICNYGRNYLAIGRLVEGIENLTDKELLSRKAEINGMLWAYIIFSNNLMEVSENFYAPTINLYSGTFLQEAQKDDPNFVLNAGFWKYDAYNLGNNYMLPDKLKDVFDFVSVITVNTTEQMNVLLKGHDALRMKYDALISDIKLNYGFDLQAIGNAKKNKL